MYIYGILNSNTSLHLSTPKDLLFEESESNGVVYTIPHQDISALVRDSEIVDTSTSSFDKLRTSPEQSRGTLSINPERAKRVERVDYTHMRKDILARLLIDHQTVIERVMNAQITIIPMRLGTFAQDETEIRDILSKGYNLIKEIFERISDKIEIDVVANWSDFTSVVKEAGEEREIKELKERLLAEPKGITVDDQMMVVSCHL